MGIIDGGVGGGGGVVGSPSGVPGDVDLDPARYKGGQSLTQLSMCASENHDVSDVIQIGDAPRDFVQPPHHSFI